MSEENAAEKSLSVENLSLKAQASPKLAEIIKSTWTKMESIRCIEILNQ